MPLLPPPSAQQWRLVLLATGQSQSLAAWGLENCHLTIASLIPDAFVCTRPTQKIEDPALCAFGDQVALIDPQGRIVFKGKRIEMAGNASGANEHQAYRFANVWWDLSKRIYHQLWTTFIQAGDQVSSSQTYNPHLILNTAGRTVAQEIEEIIAYAALQGVDIAVGEIVAPVSPPPNEVTSRDCASLIQELAAWAPGNLAWFEYGESTSDPPRFHFKPPDDSSTVSLAAFGPNGPEDLSIRARHEDVVPSVAIRYEKTDQLTHDGVTREYPTHFTDLYPPSANGREERAFSAVVQLTGFTKTTVSAQILCGSFPGDNTNADFETVASLSASFPPGFWKRPQFNLPISDSRIKLSTLTISAGSFIRSGGHTEDGDTIPALTTLPRFLIAGELADWMEDSDGNPLDWQRQVLSANFNYDLYDSNDNAVAGAQFGVIEKVTNKVHAIYLTATNAPEGLTNYNTVTSFAQGEQPPVGLAQYLYEQLSELGYSGTRRSVALEANLEFGLGHRLNLTGGDPAWASMNALIQRIDVDIAQGAIEITFGIAPTLSLGRIMELLRNARTRRRWTAVEQRDSGDLGVGGNNVELGQASPDTNSAPGLKQLSYYAVKEGSKKVSIDASAREIIIQTSTVGAGNFTAACSDTESTVLMTGAGGSIDLRTSDCLHLGVARTIRIKAVKSCDPTDPPNSSWVRLVPCSDRIRIS